MNGPATHCSRHSPPDLAAVTLGGKAGFSLPYAAALAFDAAGNLWVGTAPYTRDEARIYRFDDAALPALTIASDVENGRHLNFAFHAGDLRYTTNTTQIGRIPAADLAGTGSFTDDMSHGITLPQTQLTAVGFDSRGNLWTLAYDGTMLTIMADDLDEPQPVFTTRELSVTASTGAFVFID